MSNSLTKYSWNDSALVQLLNNRFLQALPTTLQAILCKSNVKYFPTKFVSNGDYGNSVQLDALTEQNRYYIAAYSSANVMDDNSIYDAEDILMSPLTWRDNSQVQCYTFNNNSWSINSSMNGTQYLNLRFQTKDISFGTGADKMCVYILPSGANAPSNVATSIGASRLKSGDIYVEGSTSYMYVSNKEINTYGLYVETEQTNLVGLPDNTVANINSTNAGRGGWIKAESYWTRSLIPGGTQYTVFRGILSDGTVEESISNNTIGNKFSYILAI